MKKVLLEGLLVVAFGVALAGLANALSPRGLQLARDYFPQDKSAAVASHAITGSAAITNEAGAIELLRAKLRQQGLGLADTTLVGQIYQDPRRAQNLILFIDARSAEHFHDSHIPGAYLLDNFHPYDQLATVLPLCQAAEQIVVYCHGGNCDDSLGVATLLTSAQIPPQKIVVYGGGFSEWTRKGMPVELGDRNSGQIRTGSQ